MQVCGLILLSCLTFVFIPWYAEAQTALSSNETITSSENLTSDKIPSSNGTVPAQDRQLLEQQFFNTGNDLFHQGNYTDAITYYDKALELNSTDTNVLYNKALALDNLGRVNEAITYYDKVLAISPNDTYSLNNKGLALDNLGKHDEAITYYDKILAINPNDADALYNKGLALEELGKKSEATSYYRKVLAVDPIDTAALNKLNLTYNNANNTITSGVQKTDQALLVAFGVFASLAIGIFLISLVVKRKRPTSETQVITKAESTGMDQILDKKYNLEEIDDEWKGI